MIKSVLVVAIVFSTLMIVFSFIFPKVLAIVGIFTYLFAFRKIATLPKGTAWKDLTMLGALLLTSTVASIGTLVICGFSPIEISCSSNVVRSHIFLFYAFPLIPYLVFFLVMSLPHYIKLIFRQRY